MKPNEKAPEKKSDHRGPMHFDFKNTALLSKYINQHARMQGKRRSGLSTREQHLLSQAVKRARFMALMPYIAR